MNQFVKFTASVAVVLAGFVALAAPAHAQYAPAYWNDFESPSDISNWGNYGYPFSWNVDNSPMGGHNSANSLNFNNGTDINGDWPYGDIYNYNSPIDINGLSNPVLSFWCYYETANESTYPDHRILWTYDPNYNYFYGYEFSGDGSTPWGYQSTDCASMNGWHQHVIQLQSDLVSSGALITEFYFTSDSYYQGSGLDGWFIDDLQILVPDVTPPVTTSDLAASNPELDSLDVTWTSPADDDITGVAASFDLRYSATPIDDSNFGAATAVLGEPSPAAPGTTHTMTITGLSDSTTYYFALKTTDLAGNVSNISNVASLATVTPPPPPPPPSTGGPAPTIPKEIDTILPCAAGTSAQPTGLLVLAGLIALAAGLRGFRK